MTRDGAERVYLEQKEASASSGIAREGHQASAAMPTEGAKDGPELSSSSSSAWTSDRSLTYNYLKDLRKFDRFYGQNPDRYHGCGSSDSNPVSSPINGSEVIAVRRGQFSSFGGGSPTNTMKVFFTTPNGPLEFFHLSSDTTGWDVVTQKGCFAYLETNNLYIAHQSSRGGLSSKIVEQFPDLREGDTLEFRLLQDTETLPSGQSQSGQSSNSGNQVRDPPNPSNLAFHLAQRWLK